MNPLNLATIAKYGISGAIALYLVVWMTTKLDERMADINTTLSAQTSILTDIRYTLKAEKGLSFRNDATLHE